MANKTKNRISLQAKQAYVRKSRSGNYVASMHLEGLALSAPAPSSATTLSGLLEKYKTPAR
jgi:hypothetical protein